MAENKKQRKSPNGRPKKKRPKLALQKIGNKILIKPHVLTSLKDSPDFAVFVRIGRLLNALNYMIDLLNLPYDSSDPVLVRRFHRTLINAGGYLYEGYQLAESLRLEFNAEPSFGHLKAILTNSDRRNRLIVQKIRHVAFHLDHADKTTKAALGELVVKGPVVLVSAKDGELGNLHFNLADVIDRCYLIDELKREDQSEEEVLDEITDVITHLIREFSIASDEFFRGLAKRLKLI